MLTDLAVRLTSLSTQPRLKKASSDGDGKSINREFAPGLVRGRSLSDRLVADAASHGIGILIALVLTLPCWAQSTSPSLPLEVLPLLPGLVNGCVELDTGGNVTSSVVIAQTLIAAGGAPSAHYTWSLSPGSSFPPGTMVDSATGIFQWNGGTLAPGTYSFTMVVSDGTTQASGTFSYTIDIGSPCGVPVVPPPFAQVGPARFPLPFALPNQAYGVQLFVQVGFSGAGPCSLNLPGACNLSLPLTWSLAPGSQLPAGLTLDPSTGVIHGTPTSVGTTTTFTFSVVVTNAAGQVAACLTAGCIQYSIGQPELVDPVPALLEGNSVISVANGAQRLASQGRMVVGVSADGVSQVVLRVPTPNVGEQFTLTILDSNLLPSSNPDEDGALGNPGDPLAQLAQTSITVTSVDTSNTTTPSPMAFVVYRAPKDFPRSNGLDAGSATRQVFLQSSNPTTGFIGGVGAITIVRPPVVLVHGLWDEPDTWDHFAPLSTSGSTSQGFFVRRADYHGLIGNLISTSRPSYRASRLRRARRNALGFDFNAPLLMSQIKVFLDEFRMSNQVARMPVAAVQADIVAHSMGGDITRTLPLVSPVFPFFSSENYGQGSVHKLITIDTPHLGSPLATALLDPANTCVRKTLAFVGNMTFASVTTTFGSTEIGAVADLQPTSQAIANLNKSNIHPLPTAFVVGVTDASNLNGLTTIKPTLLRFVCGTLGGDPLATNLTPTAWNSVFAGQPNDAIVTSPSQTNNLGGGTQFTGFVHSDGVKALGFNGPSMLNEGLPQGQAGVVPTEVINLLNTPISQFTPLAP
jgi:pimeloyl-ACP methyl ester carboxylesterase